MPLHSQALPLRRGDSQQLHPPLLMRTSCRFPFSACALSALTLLACSCGPPLAAPQNLRATPNSGQNWDYNLTLKQHFLSHLKAQEVRLEWDKVPGVTGYNVYWSTAPGVSKQTASVLANVRSPCWHNADNKGTYYYVVTALRGRSESPPSKEVSARPRFGSNGSRHVLPFAFAFETPPTIVGIFTFDSSMTPHAAALGLVHARGNVGRLLVEGVSIELTTAQIDEDGFIRTKDFGAIEVLGPAPSQTAQGSSGGFYFLGTYEQEDQLRDFVSKTKQQQRR